MLLELLVGDLPQVGRTFLVAEPSCKGIGPGDRQIKDCFISTAPLDSWLIQVNCINPET
jgi:hypothetical protein